MYIAVVSISGSALVYREALEKRFRRIVTVIHPGGRRMDPDELEKGARQRYSQFEVVSVVVPRQIDRPAVVVFERDNRRFARLLDPYTAADLGEPGSTGQRLLGWLADLHDNLLSGLTGRIVNGVGAFLVVCLSLTGGVIWWPGIRNWRRSTRVTLRARFARFNWDLHSAMGFWCWVLLLCWGLSGICLCFPGVLNPLLGSTVRLWITRLHFGRFHWTTEALWTILGLAPAALAVTGAIMWWNRVLRKKLG